MTVWVAIAGCYSSQGVTGVYATVEAGIADNPLPKKLRTKHAGDLSRPGGWKQHEDGSWDNGLDWENAVSLQPWELQGAVVMPMMVTEDDGGGS